MTLKFDFDVLDKVFITSDTHAFHKNITRGTTEWEGADISKLRDFDTPEEMTKALADNFNTVIPKDAILIHLGDFSFGGEQNIPIFRELITCENIIMVTGNHDHHIEKGKYDELFMYREKYIEISFGKGVHFCLFHFPISSWNSMGKGYFHLHGHQHWTGDDRFGNGRMMDVGVDGGNLMPYKLTDVVDMIKDRQAINPKDHHITSSK